MVGEIFGGISALKTAFDMAKGLENIHETVARDRAIIDLQKEILAAQGAQASLIENVGTLKSRVAELEAWDADKQRYKLIQIGHGMVAYTLKEGMEEGEPPHYVCAICYSEGHKSIMQTETRSPGRCEVLVCSDLYLSGMRQPEHHTMKRQRR